MRDPDTLAEEPEVLRGGSQQITEAFLRDPTTPRGQVSDAHVLPHFGEDVHEEEEDVDRGPPSNAFFFERANCRHRGDLDVLLGSKCLRLASATLFDVIMPRTSEIFKSRNTISSTGSWQWVRNFLDGAIDLEVGANVLCSEGAIDTEETETNRVRFRT